MTAISIRRSCKMSLLQGMTALLVTLGLSISPVFAEYQVDPLRIEVTLPEGKSVGTTAVTVRNTGEDTVRLKAYLSNWVMDETGKIQFTEETVSDGIMDKVRFNPKEFEIPVGQAQVVRLAVSLPADSPEGEYRGILFFEDLKTTTQRLSVSKVGYSAAIELKQRLGIGVYTYKGKITPKPTLAQFGCRVDNGNLVAELTIDNKGSKHYRGTGTFLVMQKDATGKATPFKEIPLQQAQDILILGGKKQTLSQVLSSPKDPLLPPGKYAIELHLSSKEAPDLDPLESSADVDFSHVSSAIPETGEMTPLKETGSDDQAPMVTPGGNP